MASSKAKVGVNSESNSLKESKSNAGSSSAGEASPNSRVYCLEDLETIATVGEFPNSTQAGKVKWIMHFIIIVQYGWVLKVSTTVQQQDDN